MTKITDKQIAEASCRSPQVISAMKRSYPEQYDLLKVGTYCVKNGIVSDKDFDEMNINELIDAQDKLIELVRSAIGDLEVVSDFIADKKERL